jgi:cytidylate kinase
MYRAVTWKAIQQGVDLASEQALAAVADSMHVDLPCASNQERVLADGIDVTQAIRTPELTAKVFYAARSPEVRKRVGRWQRKFGEAGGIVAEGRDMTTVIFPDADVKFYLDAAVDERARRRCDELRAKGEPADFQTVRRELVERDRSDLERAVSPLRRADDAVYVDTTNLLIDQTLARLVAEVEARTGWRRPAA